MSGAVPLTGAVGRGTTALEVVDEGGESLDGKEDCTGFAEAEVVRDPMKSEAGRGVNDGGPPVIVALAIVVWSGLTMM